MLFREPASFAFVDIPRGPSAVVCMGSILTFGSLFLWLTVCLGGGAEEGPARAVDGTAVLALAQLLPLRAVVPVEGCESNLRCPILVSGDEGAEKSEPALSLSFPSFSGAAARGRAGTFVFSCSFALPFPCELGCQRGVCARMYDLTLSVILGFLVAFRRGSSGDESD